MKKLPTIKFYTYLRSTNFTTTKIILEAVENGQQRQALQPPPIKGLS